MFSLNREGNLDLSFEFLGHDDFQLALCGLLFAEGISLQQIFSQYLPLSPQGLLLLQADQKGPSMVADLPYFVDLFVSSILK